MRLFVEFDLKDPYGGSDGRVQVVPVTITVELDVLHCKLMAVPQCVGGWQQVSYFSFGHETVCLCVFLFCASVLWVC